MGIIQLLILAVSLSMDAFAISICKGLALRKIRISSAVTVGVYFGVFQALMPAIGYALGISFRETIEEYDHWIAFGLLAFLGGRMIWESMSSDERPEDVSPSLGVREMLLLALATSIDALAAGITLAFLKVNIMLASSLIGIITFVLSCLGVYVGGIFGEKYKSIAERIGGAALVILGIKILIEHING